MYIQYSRLPIQFRLSQWEGNINENDRRVIINFLETKNSSLGKHLLIFGGIKSGKSPLCVGIATELCIKRNSCSYYTGMKLYNLFSLTDEAIIEAEDCDLWSWRTASLLIIDDVNPGSPIPENFVSPEQLLKMIDAPVNSNIAVQNRTEFVKKDVIWVMGKEDNELNQFDNWKEMLLEIGVPENKIYSIHLGFSTT